MDCLCQFAHSGASSASKCHSILIMVRRISAVARLFAVLALASQRVKNNNDVDERRKKKEMTASLGPLTFGQCSSVDQPQTAERRGGGQKQNARLRPGANALACRCRDR